MEPPRRRRIRKLLPRRRATSTTNFELTPLPREIRRLSALLRESLPPKIEKDRILQAEPSSHPHAGAQSSSWFANKVVPSDPRRRSRHELRASTRGAVPPALVADRCKTSPQSARGRDRHSGRHTAACAHTPSESGNF